MSVLAEGKRIFLKKCFRTGQKTSKIHVRSEDKKRGNISYRTWPFSSFAGGGKLALIVYFSTSINAETWDFFLNPFLSSSVDFPWPTHSFGGRRRKLFSPPPPPPFSVTREQGGGCALPLAFLPRCPIEAPPAQKKEEEEERVEIDKLLSKSLMPIIETKFSWHGL